MGKDKKNKVTRVEVIDNDGRSYQNFGVNELDVKYQDGDRTLKIFIKSSKKTEKRTQKAMDDGFNKWVLDLSKKHSGMFSRLILGSSKAVDEVPSKVKNIKVYSAFLGEWVNDRYYYKGDIVGYMGNRYKFINARYTSFMQPDISLDYWVQVPNDSVEDK